MLLCPVPLYIFMQEIIEYSTFRDQPWSKLVLIIDHAKKELTFWILWQWHVNNPLQFVWLWLDYVCSCLLCDQDTSV